MRIAALFLVICRCLAAQDAGIRGIVIDSVTRQPLAGVHIMVYALPPDNAPSEDVYGAVSQPNGRFSIATMKPASYLFNVRRTGFVQVPGKGLVGSAAFSVSLKAGEQLTGYTIEMSPRGLISGSVTDEDGLPVRNVQIQATAVSSDGPKIRDTMYGNTDDRGQYRMTGLPGKYRIKADFRPQGSFGMGPEVRSDGTQPAVYGTTWYPSAETEDHGGVVEVAAGRDLDGIDIRLARQQSFSISGVVTGLPNKSTRAFLYLFPSGGEMSQQFGKVRSITAAPDGTFAFSGIAPGAYRLSAQAYGGVAQMRSPAIDVRIDGADAAGIRINVSAGEELSGTVEIAGDPPPGKPDEKPVVMLETLSEIERAYAGGQAASSEVDKQGAFKIPSVFPSRVRVKVDPLPENAYVKSVKLDGAESPDGIIDLSRGVRNSSLKVLVARNGAQVSGTVMGDDGKPVPAGVVYVALAASADDISYERMKRIAPGGTFSFKGVRPGKYRLFAIDAYLARDIENDVRVLFPKAPEVVVREGDKIAKQAPLMTKEKPGAR